MKKSLSRHISLVFNSIIICLLLITTTIQLVTSNQLMLRDAENILDKNAIMATTEFKGWISEQSGKLSILVNELEQSEMHTTVNLLPDYFKYHANIDPRIKMLFFASPEHIYTSTNWNPGVYNPTVKDWYIGAMSSPEVYVSDPYIDASTGDLVITISQQVVDKSNIPVGVLAIDIDIQTLIDIILDIDTGDGTYSFVINDDNQVVIHPSKEFQPKADGTLVELSQYEYINVISQPENTSIVIHTANGEEVYSKWTQIPYSDWKLISNYPTRFISEEFWSNILSSSLLCICTIIVSIFLIRKFTKRYITPIERASEMLAIITQGNIKIDTTSIPIESREIAVLVDGTSKLSQMLNNYLQEISAILNAFAQGNFTAGPKQNYIGDFKVIQESLTTIGSTLKDVFREISASIGELDGGAADLSSSAMELATTTLEQAELLQEFKTDTINVTDEIIGSIDNIDKSYKIVKDMTAKATDGKNISDQMVAAMHNITESTNEISQVITSIDSIATQTNLLALNASIEAARAGEGGKGFAIVAMEIRDLSTQTTEIVKRIYELINTSLNNVKQGEAMVALTTDALNNIVSASNQSVEISEIVHKNALGQRDSLHAVVKNTEKLANEMSKNTAISEENVAISEELAAQSNALRGQMSKFKIN
ncbi:methyl-accepting chemotaxis protein [Candidatus Epulonipiscium viviparus]|uniref:methyl-accepting chemotaxis protein n=1 Tax=Candidatus Epulonipiscium viviparus TaxID=420336 RepID=UPI0027380648|nr:methyl-accepting chemotaxis protein [Candidatus Epulopiscium viviparus]